MKGGNMIITNADKYKWNKKIKEVVKSINKENEDYEYVGELDRRNERQVISSIVSKAGGLV